MAEGAIPCERKLWQLESKTEHLSSQLQALREDLKDRDQRLEEVIKNFDRKLDNYVDKPTFRPYAAIVGGLVAIILVTVFTSWLSSVMDRNETQGVVPSVKIR